MFTVQETDYNNLDPLIELYKKRYEWLKNNKIDMWKIDQLEKDKLIDKYENPKFYIAYEDIEIVGGFLLIERDVRYWPVNINDCAFYFHKFVISIEKKGKGYSDKVLEYVKNYAKLMNKKYVRLDYEIKREYLRKMYLRNGFIDIEIINKNGVDIVKSEYEI